MRVTINVPDELYDEARAVSEAHRVPVEEIFVSAFADQLAAWQRLRERCVRGDRSKFLIVLEKVPDIEAEEFDRS